MNRERGFAALPALRGHGGVRFWIIAVFLLLGALAPRPAAAQTGGIQGQVLSRTGQRLEGVTVRVTQGPTQGETQTLADGTFELAGLNPGDYRFVAGKEGFGSAVRQATVISGQNVRVNFILEPEGSQGATIQGFVRQRGSRTPVSGARVTITRNGRSQSETTDDRGFYSFSGLQAGRYQVAAARRGFQKARRGGVRVRDGQTATVSLDLRPKPASLGRVQGRVTNPDGRAVRGARVSLFLGNRQVASDLTNGNGKYLIRRVVPDTYTLQVTATGFETAVVREVSVPSGGRRRVNVRLARLGTATAVIEGTVQDSEGRGVRGARVQIAEGPLAGRFDVTNASGEFTLRSLPEGEYTVRATASGFAPAEQGGIEVIAGEREVVQFTLERSGAGQTGSVAGQVRDQEGTLLPDVRVRSIEGPSIGHVAVSEDDGDYSLANLPIGTYTLRFSQDGFQDLTVPDVAVAAGQVTPLDVELRSNEGLGVLTGFVSNAVGNPLDGVHVDLFQNDLLIAGTTTSGGQYRLDGLATGFYTVRFTAPFFIPASFPVRIEEGQTTIQNATLVSAGSEFGTLAGRVRDVGGRPVQNALVEVFGALGIASTRVGPEGTYAIPGLPSAGAYTVRVSSPGMVTQQRSGVRIPAAGTAEATFTLRMVTGAGGIAGTVRQRNGLPLPGATVTLVEGPLVGEIRTTSSEGAFTYFGLRPGAYILEVSAPGMAVERVPVAVRAGVTAPVVVFMTEG